MVHCKRRSAYPNPERAAQYAVQMQSASFPALVNLDDVEQGSNDASDKWLRAFVKNATTLETDDKLKRISFSKYFFKPKIDFTLDRWSHRIYNF